MLAGFRGADKSFFTYWIRGIFQNCSQLFVLDASFLPFVSVVEGLRALFLQFGGGVGKFVAKLFIEARKSDGRVRRFIGKRKFVIKRLVIFHGKDKFARGLVGAGASEQQRGLRGNERIARHGFET